LKNTPEKDSGAAAAARRWSNPHRILEIDYWTIISSPHYEFPVNHEHASNEFKKHY
jgi:hypothetical protein